jgi:hypothetical protein
MTSDLSHTLFSSDFKYPSSRLFERSRPAGRFSAFNLEDLERDLADDVGRGKFTGRVGLTDSTRGFSDILGWLITVTRNREWGR